MFTTNHLNYVPLPEAARTIRDGDLLLIRRRGLIAIAGRGEHSHAAKAAWWGGELFCLEVREWHGGRAVTLTSQVRKRPGRIDVFHANPANRWPEYDPARATNFMRQLAGCDYGYAAVLAAAMLHLPLVRMAMRADTEDARVDRRPPFCSQACAMADRLGGGVDPVPHLADRLTEPIEVSAQGCHPTDQLSACGYGGNNQFRCIRGSVVGQATPAGAIYPSITIQGSVRPGDSGGGVLNARGLLVGVVWGERDGLTYATCGEPLRALLARVLGKSQESRADGQGPEPSNITQQLTTLEKRIAALDSRKQNKGDYLRSDALNDVVRRAELASFAKREQLDSERKSISQQVTALSKHLANVHDRVEKTITTSSGLFQGLSTGKLIAGALGLSGPLAIGVIVASGLAGKRFKSLRNHSKARSRTPALDPRPSALDSPSPIAIDTPPPPQQTVTETHYVPYETDSFAKAHQWASEQVARKYPGATELLQAQESLIKQFISAKRQ